MVRHRVIMDGMARSNAIEGIKRAAQVVLVLAALFFLGRYVYLRWLEVSQVEITFLVAPMLVGLLLLLGFYFGYSQSWQRILGWLSEEELGIGPLVLYRVFFLSFVSRYLPAGIVVQLGGRVELLKREGGRRRLAAQSLYYEQLFLVGGAGLLAWAVVVVHPVSWLPSWLTGLNLLSLGVGVVLCLILLTAPDAALRLVARILPSISERMAGVVLPPLHLIQRIELLARFLLLNFAQGAAVYFVLWAIYPQVNSIPGILLVATAAYPLSRVAGQLAPFVPGGIGVREGAFTFLLGSLLPVQPLILSAALFRFTSVVLELTILACLASIVRLRKNADGSLSNRA
jgi:uncharacterized membrane protein YbhN (UPF0104 family)